MDESFTADHITPTRFNEVLARYDKLIEELSAAGTRRCVQSSLKDMDDWRLNKLPVDIRDRRKDPWMQKDQMVDLLRWKMKRGQMRPRLMAVFASNLHVQTARRTSHAFSIHKPTADAIKTTIDYLCVLRGVGPAMASLVLSVFDQDTVPFFSDECYRWMLFADRKGQGWDRPIKYTTKEYIEYWEKVQALRKRFKDEGGQDVRAVDVEKVGFVLATEAAAARAREPARASKKRARGDEEEQDKDEEADPPSPRAKRMQRELKKLLR